jgi:hypothetical protein
MYIIREREKKKVESYFVACEVKNLYCLMSREKEIMTVGVKVKI